MLFLHRLLKAAVLIIVANANGLVVAAPVLESSIASPSVPFKLEKLIDGLGVPWGLAFITPKKLIITERSGTVQLFDLSTGKLSQLDKLPFVLSEGQGGMLDVALSPDYKTNGWIYFTYVKDIEGQGATTLARARLKNYSFYSWQELLVTQSTTDTSRHYGSRITFDEAGYVYFGVGDRGERPNSQNLKNHAGTIIRLKPDGAIPDDNPFVNNEGALDEIWSYGHRNPQGLAYDNLSKRLWEIEHGPRGGDEINLIKKGRNYGWPVISYGKEYWGPFAVGEATHKEGMEQPVTTYIPSIAPGSLMLYTGDKFPQWQGNLFAGALKLQHLNRIVLNADGKVTHEERLLESLNERIRALVQGPDGLIYFSTDSGKIYRINNN